ncbi:MAG: hypothetical protein AAFV07_02730 [Bacteroidota bacterium]
MKSGPHTYSYRKIINARPRYGTVVLELRPIKGPSQVVDTCSRNMMGTSENLWKEAALEAIKSILETYTFSSPAEVILHDVMGIKVDTFPSHIEAAVVIGIFDLMESPLSPTDIEMLDEFVGHNSGWDLIPDFRKLPLTKSKKS